MENKWMTLIITVFGREILVSFKELGMRRR